MAALIVNCSNCGTAFGARLLGTARGLGHSRYRCASCGHVMNSGRDEWPRLGAGRRVRYAVVSLVYAGLLGMLCDPGRPRVVLDGPRRARRRAGQRVVLVAGE